MKQILRVTLSLFIIFWPTILHAELRIEITQGVNTARPIGILPFHWKGTGVVPEDISSIITADLRNSGKFNPLDRLLLPQELASIQNIQSPVWKKLKIDIIVIGQIALNINGSYQIDYQLVDISGNEARLLEQNSFKITKSWLRCAAHTISNEIFEKLTGIKGAFRTRIAYVVRTSNNQLPYELHITDYDGYNKFVIHRSAQPLMSPAWSPDGSKIAYVTFESGRSSLVVQTLANATIQKISSYPCHNGAPAFSPDGYKLAFALSKTGTLNLYVIDLASGHISQITNDHYNNTEPTWFPDSQTLAYTSDQAGMPQIYRININGGAPQRLTWEGDRNQNAAISSDGKIMIMISNVTGSQHVTKQDLETGAVQTLTSTFLDETPSISPNGTMVIYSSTQEMHSVIQLVSIDGHFKSRLPTSFEQVKFPVWSPYL